MSRFRRGLTCEVGTAASSSTVNYTGNNTGGDTTINATPAYFNLGLGGGSAENYIPSTSLSISNDLTMNANGTLIGTNSVTVNLSHLVGDLSITPRYMLSSNVRCFIFSSSFPYLI